MEPRLEETEDLRLTADMGGGLRGDCSLSAGVDIFKLSARPLSDRPSSGAIVLVLHSISRP